LVEADALPVHANLGKYAAALRSRKNGECPIGLANDKVEGNISIIDPSYQNRD
jgi:hypothetical protein